METTSRGGTPGSGGECSEPPRDPRSLEPFLRAGFPWYGLDEAFDGPRWAAGVGLNAEGTVEHGSLGHGEPPSVMTALPLFDPDAVIPAFCVVVTLADRPTRPCADGTGQLEAASVSTAAWLAGSGLLSCTWPGRMDRALRQDWLDQQTAIAWELADDLEGDGWTDLVLTVDGVPAPFRHRESEYGWVLAGSVDGAHLGAYGRGMSPYGVGFAVLRDLSPYAEASAGSGAPAGTGAAGAEAPAG